MFELPPPIYDHTPSIPYTIQRALASEVDSICRSLGAKGSSLACTQYSPISCTIIMPVIGIGGVTPRTYEIFLRHEFGHCNGWAPDHKDAR